jgi:hypothetical protein
MLQVCEGDSVMRKSAWVVTLALVSAVAIDGTIAARQTQGVNPTGAAVLAFKERVAEYVKVHKQADAQVPSLTETKDPAKISQREKALGDAIRQLRAGARPGDVFLEEVRPVLVKVIRDDFAQRSATDRKALIQELPPSVKLVVNMTYPTSLPLATVPAKLLRELPDLPPELEYRIVGRHLLLRDVKGNIVVDFVRDVVPTIPS